MAVLLLFVLLSALSATVWLDNAANRGVTYRAGADPIPFTDGPSVGVNLYNLPFEPDPAVVDRSFALAHDLGARYARMQAPWEDIEIHARGDFEDRRNLATLGAISAWAKYDRIVAAANAAGVELILRLERPPDWSRQRSLASPEFQAGLKLDGNSTGPPDDYADYAHFVRALVERYDGDGVDDAPAHQRVRFFQLWNEPNLMGEWNWQTPSPEEFVALLRTGAAAARAANPQAVILFPGLAPTDGLDWRAPMTELEYLDRVYKAGGADSFDIMSAQSYGLGQSPSEHRYIFLRGRGNWSWSQPIDTRSDVSRVVLLREVMERNGDAGTPVWVTEFGWNSAPEHIPPERRNTWGQPVSEQQKGDYLVEQIERARQEWPWMGVMNVWMLRYGGYTDPNPEDPTPYFALVSRDWQPLDSYRILQTYLARPATAGVGAHNWQSQAVEQINGGWRVRFNGARISLMGGIAEPYTVIMDGQAAITTRDEADGHQSLRSAWLPEGEHMLELRSTAAPDTFTVDRARPWGWFWDYGPLALLIAIAVSGAMAMGGIFTVVLSRIDVPAKLAYLSAIARFFKSKIRPDTLILFAMGLGLLIAYRASAQLPLTALGLGIFTPLALWRPDLALAYVPLTVALYFMPKSLFDARFGIRDNGIYLPLHEVVLVITAIGSLRPASCLLRPASCPPPPASCPLSPTSCLLPPAPRLLPPASLFALAGLWGFLIAGDKGPALRELRWLIIEPLIFCGLLIFYARRREPGYVTLIIGFWLAGGAMSGLVGILQFFGLNLAPLIGTKAGFSNDTIPVEGVLRVTGLYGHPNNLGLAMGRFWPLAAALAHVAFWNGPGGAARIRRSWPILLVTLLCLGGLLVSFSRGAYLGAAAGAAVLGLLLRQEAGGRRQEAGGRRQEA
ncbi:MAG: polymerase, partial [Chloroflexales bacterium]